MSNENDKNVKFTTSSIFRSCVWEAGIGAINAYFLYAYITMSSAAKNTTISNVFLASIITWLMAYVHAIIIIGYEIKYRNIEMNKKVWRLILPTNRFPLSFLKLAMPSSLVVGIWLCTVFIPFPSSDEQCAPYQNDHAACVSVKIISFFTMLGAVSWALVLLLLLIMMFVMCCTNGCDGVCACIGACCSSTTDATTETTYRNYVPGFIRDYIADNTPRIKFTSEETDCLICIEALSDSPMILGCGHKFHKPCVSEWFKHGGSNCPTCRAVVSDTVLRQVVTA